MRTSDVTPRFNHRLLPLLRSPPLPATHFSGIVMVMSDEQLSRSPTSAETPHSNSRSRKGIRNKNACDACRSRKVRVSGTFQMMFAQRLGQGSSDCGLL